MESGPGASTDDELTTDEAIALIDDLADLGIPLLLFSGGEPLVRDDFWTLARHAKKRGLVTALSTNGTLITPEVARDLTNAGVEYAGVSLDGASPETHDRLRGMPGSFDAAVRGLKNCIAASLKCGVRVTVTRDNYAEVPALIDLALSLGVPRFCVYWLVPCGRGRALTADMQLRHGEIRDLLDHLYRRAREVDPAVMEFLTVDAPQDTVHLLATLQREDAAAYASMCALVKRTGVGCSAGDRVANIDPIGNVYPCQFARLEELCIGSVRTSDFGALWNDLGNPVLARFREKRERAGGACGACAHRDMCGGGCRIRALAENGDLWAEDPLCPLGAEIADDAIDCR
jgi:radical SAM protein with 4Fe4S-binding SPASM domain